VDRARQFRPGRNRQRPVSQISVHLAGAANIKPALDLPPARDSAIDLRVFGSHITPDDAASVHDHEICDKIGFKNAMHVETRAIVDIALYSSPRADNNPADFGKGRDRAAAGCARILLWSSWPIDGGAPRWSCAHDRTLGEHAGRLPRSKIAIAPSVTLGGRPWHQGLESSQVPTPALSKSK